MSAAVRVGDPDPTDDVWSTLCLAPSLEGYACTADVGHDGPHFAADGHRVVAVWDMAGTR